MESLKRVYFSIFLFPIVFLAVGLLFIFTGYSDYQDYKTAQDITAIVTACESDVDTEGDWHYRIYISYTFDGNEFSDIYWKSRNNAIDVGQMVSVKVSPNNPEKPFSGNPLSLLIWGVPFALSGIIFSFKLIPASFTDKEDFLNRTQIPNKSKKVLWFALIPVVPSIVFLLLGLNFSPLFHIGTILFAYFSVVLAEILAA